MPMSSYMPETFNAERLLDAERIQYEGKARVQGSFKMAARYVGFTGLGGTIMALGLDFALNEPNKSPTEHAINVGFFIACTMMAGGFLSNFRLGALEARNVAKAKQLTLPKAETPPQIA